MMKLKPLIYAPLCLILSSFEKKVALKKLLLFKLKIHFRPNPQFCALFIKAKLLLETRWSLTYPMLDLNLALQPSTASTAKIQI